MSQVKAFTVGSVTYNAAMASAVQQDELLSMLTAPLMERAMAAAQVDKPLSDEIIVPMLMSMHYATKTKIAALLMGRVFVNGTQVPVTVDDFSGRIVEYNQLLTQLIMWNLGDFFDWLQSVLANAKQLPDPRNVA